MSAAQIARRRPTRTFTRCYRVLARLLASKLPAAGGNLINLRRCLSPAVSRSVEPLPDCRQASTIGLDAFPRATPMLVTPKFRVRQQGPTSLLLGEIAAAVGER